MDEQSAVLTVADIAIEPVACVAAHCTVQEVARLLDTTRQGAVVLMTDPPTIVTDHDIVAATATGVVGDAFARDLVVEPVPVVRQTTPLADALRRMLGRELSNVVVVDARGRIAGVVSLRHVVTALMSGPPWVGALRRALHVEVHQQ